MIIKIFTGPLNYDVNTLYEKDEMEYIIGCDQGCQILMENNIPIDLAVGDFDSIQDGLLEEIKKYARKTKVYPSEKDYTDTFLAVNEAICLPHDEIIIYGGIGGRFDHSYANMNLLKIGNIRMKNDDSEMFILKPGMHYIENDYKYISFFSIEDIMSFTIKGFKYELNNVELIEDDPLCISNEGSGTISFTNGLLLVIMQNE